MIAEMVHSAGGGSKPNASTLGIGLYTPAEAALYARVRPRLVSRWVFGDAKNDSVIVPQIGDKTSKTVSFLDLIQTMAIREIRNQYDVPLQRIRGAVDLAKRLFDLDYPFAMHHRTFVIREGMDTGDIVLEVDGKLVQLSGKHKKQQMIGPIAELYMDQVRFGEDGLACEYTAWESGPETIRLNPHIRFGEPIISGCGYSARALWDAVRVEGGFGAAADAYGVPEDTVKLAYAYFDHLINNSDAA